MHTAKIITAAVVLLAGTFAFTGAASAALSPFGFGSSGFGGLSGFGHSTFGDDMFCRGGFGGLVDVDTRARSSFSRRSGVDLDEDDVFSGIVLDRSGFNVDFRDVADFDREIGERSTLDQRTNVDREDILSALALGVRGGSRFDALGCAADVRLDRGVNVRERQDVDLDEDDALLAIAFDRNIGGFFDFDDIFSGSFSRDVDIFEDRDVDIDRRDALLLLALD